MLRERGCKLVCGHMFCYWEWSVCVLGVRWQTVVAEFRSCVRVEVAVLGSRF